MFRSLLLRLAATSAVLAGTAAQGSPRPPAETHRPSQPAPASLLPDAAPMANAAAALGHVYGGTPIDVLTYHYDRGRTGWNQSETDLTPAAVASAKFGLAHHPAGGRQRLRPAAAGLGLPYAGRQHARRADRRHRPQQRLSPTTRESYQLLWQRQPGRAAIERTTWAAATCNRNTASPARPSSCAAPGAPPRLYLVAATEPSSPSASTPRCTRSISAPAPTRPRRPSSHPPPPCRTARTVVSTPRTSGAAPAWPPTAARSTSASARIATTTGQHLRLAAALTTPFCPAQGRSTPSRPQGGCELASIWMTGFAPAIDG